MIFGLSNSYGDFRSRLLEGFNWYNVKSKTKKLDDKKLPETSPEAEKERFKELPSWERNIKNLQLKHEEAHRKALDDPTPANLINELKLEREMMKKSEIYGQRRVAVAMLSSEFHDMSRRTNVLQRKIQEQVDNASDRENLVKLSRDWGLLLEVQDGCSHCHVFAPIVLEFANDFNFELIAASKDGKDFDGIEGVRDTGQMLVFNPKRETPMLYLLKKDGKEVLPVSRGINSPDQIINNIKMIDKHLRRLF